MKKVMLIVGVVVLIMATGTWIAFAGPTTPSSTTSPIEAVIQSTTQPPDSGIISCQETADRAKIKGEKPKLGFAETRAKFQNSQDADIRIAGVTLVDTLEKVDAVMADDDASLDATMGALLAMKLAWTELQKACGKHGIDIPNLPASKS